MDYIDSNSRMIKALGRYDKDYEKDGRFIYRHETGQFFIVFNNSGGFWQVVMKIEHVQSKIPYFILFVQNLLYESYVISIFSIQVTTKVGLKCLQEQEQKNECAEAVVEIHPWCDYSCPEDCENWFSGIGVLDFSRETELYVRLECGKDTLHQFAQISMNCSLSKYVLKMSYIATINDL